MRGAFVKPKFRAIRMIGEDRVAEDSDDWNVPLEARPRPRDYRFDIDVALSAVVGVKASVPENAFTAQTLGTERSGNGVLIRDDGIVLTIGYLITEADTVWLKTNAGRHVPAHVLAIDQTSGLGVVQALEALDVPPLVLGDSRHAGPGDAVIVGAYGGRRRSLAAQIVARQEFAGYWEYLIEEAIFTAPAHPNWGGTALIDAEGKLLGVGSLQLQHQTQTGRVRPLNMIVPSELLTPVLDDLVAGRITRAPRPWLGLYAQENDNTVVVLDVAHEGPARRAGLRRGDIVRHASAMEITNLADFYRSVWASGPAGADVELTIDRDGDVFDVRVTSGDRRAYLKTPRLH